MNRRDFITGLALAGLGVGQAVAGPIEDFFVKELTAQGYANFDISKTWLGRIRIVATNAKYRRELIINPRTGEILRDIRQLLGDFDSSRHFFDDDNRGSNSGSGSGDDHGDDHGDDDKHDDHGDDHKDDHS